VAARRISARVALHSLVALFLAFMVMPILAVVPTAFSDASFLRLPPQGYSTRWFIAFFEDAQWRTSLVTSLRIAVLATILSVGMGTLAALGMARLPPRLRVGLKAVFIAPMILPVIVTAVSLYFMALQVGLQGTETAMVLGHSLLCIPFVLINVEIALRAVDPTWLHAAAGLGAPDAAVFRTVVLPNILPGIMGGAVFSFITSFDEVIVSIFLAGYSTKTLPVKMWEEIRLEFTPVVAVGAVLLIALTLVLFGLDRLGRLRRGERSGDV